MVLLALVEEVCAVKVRKVTNKTTGLQEDFKTIGLKLRSGRDVVYAEAIQKNADAVISQQTSDKPLNHQLCWCDLSLDIRDFTDKNDEKRCDTRINLLSIVPANH